MDIETVVVVALVFAITALAAAAHKQRRKDVLYGPYIVSPFQQRWNNIAGAINEG
jgi:hypothetical protein